MVLALDIPSTGVELNFPKGLSSEAFEQLCFANRELKVERYANGKIYIMSPVSGRSGRCELKFNGALYSYVTAHGGESFSSSTGFILPNGAMKSPDACWVTQEKIDTLTEADFDHLLEITPDFVVEVVSPTDQIKIAHTKMELVWIANGVRLGWLVDVKNEKLWVYRSDGTSELIDGFDRVITGENVVPGFSFDLSSLY